MKPAIETLSALQTLPVSAAFLDPSGTIVAVNERWKDFGRRNGLRTPNFGIGTNYLDQCRADDPQCADFVEKLRKVLAGRMDLVTFVYPCNSPHRQRWFSLIAMPLSLSEPRGAAILHLDITALVPARQGGAQRRAGSGDEPDFDIAKAGAAIEQSVSTTLTSELRAILADTCEDEAAHDDEDEDERPALSKRQFEVLRLLGEGKSNKEIARVLSRSPHTIKLHVSAILQQLNLRSRTQAALVAAKFERNSEPLGIALGNREKSQPAGS
jgi:DNA-binding CsgD family transcriptional regulator